MKSVACITAVLLLLAVSFVGCGSSHQVTVDCDGHTVTLTVRDGATLGETTHTVRLNSWASVEHTVAAYYTDPERHMLYTRPVTQDLTLYAREKLKGYPNIRFDLDGEWLKFYLMSWGEEVSAADFVTAVLGTDEDPADFLFFHDEGYTQPFEMVGTGYADGQEAHLFDTYRVYVKRA